MVNVAIATGFERRYPGAQAAGRHALGRPRPRGQDDGGAGGRGGPARRARARLPLLGWDPDATWLSFLPSPRSAPSPSPARPSWPARCGPSSPRPNGLYLVLLLLGGMIIPLSGAARARSKRSPSSCPAAPGGRVDGTVTAGAPVPGWRGPPRGLGGGGAGAAAVTFRWGGRYGVAVGARSRRRVLVELGSMCPR